MLATHDSRRKISRPKTKPIKKYLARVSFAAALGGLLIKIQPLFAQSSAFSYHGFLNDQGAPANAIYDLRFRPFAPES